MYLIVGNIKYKNVNEVFSTNHYNLQTAWDIELEFGTSVKQLHPFIRENF